MKFIKYVLIFISVALLSLSFRFKNKVSTDNLVGTFPISQPILKYGFCLDTVFYLENTIKKDDILANILLTNHVPYSKIHTLAITVDTIFSVKNLRVDKPYTIISKSNLASPEFFIYDPSPFYYVIYDINNPINSRVVQRKTHEEIAFAKGTITSSLWNTIIEQKIHNTISIGLEDAFAWSVDFHHLQKGDEFKAIYIKQSIDDVVVGTGAISAAYFKHFGEKYYAFYFKTTKSEGYYDEKGNPLKKAFLKAPVKFSRISSGYSMNRKHPVLGYRKAHLGTDYAAPEGTPIFSVADGVIKRASRTKNNGNFVKIKHDDIYQTQYLHMSKIATGIKPGVFVKQGQTIGYVGHTGLATGNHVCFRFWKNGKQINHLREKFATSPSDKLPKEYIEDFLHLKDSLITIIEEI